MKFLAFGFAVVSMVLMVKGKPQAQKNPDSAFAKEQEEAILRRELENLVKNLDDDQLELLESIMGRDVDETAEFDLITTELKEMGMDEEDIDDLKQLSEMMHEFLKQIPALATKLELRKEVDLLDNIQLYLLGLPNKLGPLGYIALKQVLEEIDEADGEIVDIKVEPVLTSATSTTMTPAAPVASDTAAPTFRRKRSTPLEQLMLLRRNM